MRVDFIQAERFIFELMTTVFHGVFPQSKSALLKDSLPESLYGD